MTMLISLASLASVFIFDTNNIKSVVADYSESEIITTASVENYNSKSELMDSYADFYEEYKADSNKVSLPSEYCMRDEYTVFVDTS